MSFSIIVPVYDCPKQTEKLLSSLVINLKHCGHYTEVIIIDDGSVILSKDVCEEYKQDLLIKYYKIPHSGPGAARNFGVKQSVGEYLIFLDSDVTLPPGYLQAVLQELYYNAPDAFGGPEKYDSSFSILQRAYCCTCSSTSASSLLYGSDIGNSVYYPRTYNMGIRRDAFDSLGGFSNISHGEDIALSFRIIGEKKSCRQFLNAWVFHKRQESLCTFAKKSYKLGEVRAILSEFNPKSSKRIMMFALLANPLILVLFVLSFVKPIVSLPLIVFVLSIIIKTIIRERNFLLGIVSAITTIIYVFFFGFGHALRKIK